MVGTQGIKHESRGLGEDFFQLFFLCSFLSNIKQHKDLRANTYISFPCSFLSILDKITVFLYTGSCQVVAGLMGKTP